MAKFPSSIATDPHRITRPGFHETMGSPPSICRRRAPALLRCYDDRSRVSGGRIAGASLEFVPGHLKGGEPDERTIPRPAAPSLFLHDGRTSWAPLKSRSLARRHIDRASTKT